MSRRKVVDLCQGTVSRLRDVKVGYEAREATGKRKNIQTEAQMGGGAKDVSVCVGVHVQGCWCRQGTLIAEMTRR